MKLDLEGRHCFVTGAATGIGRAIALELVQEGARVTIAGRNSAELEKLEEQFPQESRGGFIAADLAQEHGLQQAVDSVASLAPAILVNCAGASYPVALEDNPDQAFWDHAFRLNFTPARRLAEAALPAMKSAGWGRIINITGALTLNALNAATPAKAATVSWSRALSIEVARYGITVNCVAPGKIVSAQTNTRLYPTEADRQHEIEARIPMGRFGEPDELSALVALLASPRASYFNGTMIPVDGGFLRLDLK